MTLKDKLDKLENILKSYKRITVALSGGVDSAFLLAFARKVLSADNAEAVTACGPHLAEDEVKYAAKLCNDLGIRHDIVNIEHIMPILAPNPADRCYHCKKAMFSILKEFVAKESADDFVLADGTNLDDMDDYRPGHRALTELKIVSPLKEAGLTKNDIREALVTLANDLPLLDNGMHIWEKPAFACLASRVPYGETITKDKLKTIYEAESFLRELGFTQVRLRHHSDIARIEVEPKDRNKFFDEFLMDEVNDKLKKLGFKYVTLDLGGYKMGGGYHGGQEKK